MLETESIKRNPMFVYLVVLTISSTVGLQTWTTLFNNFAVDVASLGGNHVGMIQSIREIPGFLALLAVFAIRFIREHRLSAVSILVLGAGLATTGFFPSYAGIAITTLVSSFGFHYYETNVINLTDRFVLGEEFSCRDFMLSWIFSSRPDRFYSSLKNIEKLSYQANDFGFGFMQQQRQAAF